MPAWVGVSLWFERDLDDSETRELAKRLARSVLSVWEYAGVDTETLESKRIELDRFCECHSVIMKEHGEQVPLRDCSYDIGSPECRPCILPYANNSGLFGFPHELRGIAYARPYPWVQVRCRAPSDSFDIDDLHFAQGIHESLTESPNSAQDDIEAARDALELAKQAQKRAALEDLLPHFRIEEIDAGSASQEVVDFQRFLLSVFDHAGWKDADRSWQFNANALCYIIAIVAEGLPIQRTFFWNRSKDALALGDDGELHH